MNDKPKCLSPECSKSAVWRGQCIACYMAARAAIKAGKTTDAKLVKKNLRLKPAKRGRKPHNKFAQAMA